MNVLPVGGKYFVLMLWLWRGSYFSMYIESIFKSLLNHSTFFLSYNDFYSF